MPATTVAPSVDALSPVKRAALEKLLLARNDARAAALRIPRADPARAAGLSFAEQRLWFLDKLEPNHPFYNMPLAARVSGPLDRSALAGSLRQLCQRHQTLRYAYHKVDGQPRRTVCNESFVEPEFIDLRGESIAQPALQQLLREQAQKPFDLSRAPLLRCVVFELSADQHVVLLVMHHIISDGWSMWVMLNDLTAGYEASRQGVDSPLPPLEVEYSDYAVWQRDQIDGGRKQELVDFWKDRLADQPPMLELPTDRARPAVQDFDGATLEFDIPAQIARLLAQRADQHEATPYMVLMAAYQAWLSRITGQKELLVGTVVANRPRAELEKLIGFFVNTLALPGDLTDDPAFDDLIDRVKADSLAAFAHQDLPFDQLIEAVTPDRDQSHAALFQTALVVQNPPRDFALGEGLSMEPMLLDNGTAKYDLTFFFWQEENRWTGHVEYRTSLFEPETVRRFVDSFLALLGDALAGPGSPVSELRVLDEKQQRLLASFNDTEQVFSGPTTAHGLFQQAAERRPDHPAIVAGDQTLTFAELNSRVERMAAGLVAQGIEPGDPVVVSLPRSVDSVTAMLAAMTAGGVYIPVACNVADERLAFVIEDTSAKIVIRSEICESGGVSVDSLLSVGDSAWRPTQVAAESLAYTIYTSGSTGAPKGVQVTHGSFANFMHAHLDVLGAKQDDRVLHGMSPSFDGGLSEAFIPLAAGATMVIANQDEVLDPSRLSALIERQRITLAKFPPALLATLDPEQLTGLKTVSTGGDTLSAELANRWLPGRRVLNGYGPTEATVGATMFEITEPLQTLPPIGRPMANMRAYVLDEHLRQAPVGTPGEVCIGGAGIAQGYLNRPEETAQRFLADPFPVDPLVDGGRMYRTGDVGRWRADGVLEFLGRKDDQVQLRGYRVEPGEVAAALEHLPQVQQAFVTVKPDERGEQRLVAYLVPASEDSNADDREDKHVAAWQTLMDGSHRAAGALRDTEFDTTGWISTYTGKPIPKEEMQQWVDAAVQRVLSLEPKRVLEIGCGTGLILLQVAPGCESYVGTDFLDRSLRQLQQVVDQRDGLAEKVELRCLAADQLARLGDGRFDTIVMNSVSQYFPSSEYLLRVLKQASELLLPGGRMFLGDLRNLRLHEALAASVELSKADPRLKRRELLGRIEASLRREEELLIDPAFFETLRREIPRLSSIDIQLKKGDAHNELVRFRYDVVLQFESTPPRADNPQTLDGSLTRVSEEKVAHALNENPESLRLVSLPNPRVAGDVRAWRMLRDEKNDLSLDQLKAHLTQPADTAAPDLWRRIAGENGYQAQVTWGETADCYDVLFTRPGVTGRPPQPSDELELSQLTNQPMQQKQLARLAPELRSGLAATLPQYMLPSSFVVMDALPRTTNGKIDRDALPPPPSGRPAWATGYVAPRDTEERLIADAWEGLLGVSPVGAEDNFFDLGGHSMLAVQVMAEIEARSGVALPLAALFKQPTVEHLAELLRNPDACNAASTLIPLQTTGEGAPLFCVHPAGGAVFCYQELAARFAGERPVFGVQAHGVDGRQPPHETMQEMAAAYADAIQANSPDGPYHLCGWSIGGNIAYETARLLRERSGQVGLVGLFDAGAIPPEESVQEEDLLPLLNALFPDADHASLAEVRSMSPEEQVGFFTERAAKAGLVDEKELAASAHIFAVFQNNVSAVHQHHALPYPGRVTLLRAGEQTKTNQLFDDPKLGWGDLVGDLKVLEVPSDHTQMMSSPQVDALAKLLREELSAAERKL